jgi:Glyoxalase/Bleomycin resistance protein/Dioxygenase superfamily
MQRHHPFARLLGARANESLASTTADDEVTRLTCGDHLDLRTDQRLNSFGGRVVFSPRPTYVELANIWVIINVDGGPTDDKPEVILETPPDPDRVSSFLNIRVKDIHAAYAEWSARGAHFLTPPKQHKSEIRCYIRDPDGYLIEWGKPPTQVGTGRPLAGKRRQG